MSLTARTDRQNLLAKNPNEKKYVKVPAKATPKRMAFGWRRHSAWLVVASVKRICSLMSCRSRTSLSRP
jgi:hypothetical protein